MWQGIFFLHSKIWGRIGGTKQELGFNLPVPTWLATLGYPHSWYSKFILYTSCSSRFSPLYLILPHPTILYIIIYLLWGSLVTLSKYIHVRSSFEGFIETNLTVQSEFNLIFWFVSYNIFFIVEQVGPALVRALSLMRAWRAAYAMCPLSRQI
jgi:hypothetical protein